ncbi:MAG TPA: hypothetical protein VHP58_04335 [Alphaproteobacteria bacterium]|nr:hypothetical protein [Alphaproteobacteria bacterium]
MPKLLYATAALTLLAGAAGAQNISTRDSTTGGDYCREYTQTFTIAGKTQKGYGTACLQPDGSWQLQNSEPAEVAAPAAPASPDYAPQPSIGYVVQDDNVYITPPEPFVVGTVFIGGERHHFGPGFRPYHHGGRYYGGYGGYGPRHY